MPSKPVGNMQILAADFKLKYRDVFDLKALYRVMDEWLKERDWVDAEDGKNHYEVFFLERTHAGGDKEFKFWWRPEQIPSDNSFYKYHLDIDVHCLFMLETEIMREGKKVKADKGQLEIALKAYIELDFEGKWSKHPLIRNFKEIFVKRIMKSDLYEKHKLELYREAYRFSGMIKKYLKMKGFLPELEITPFHPGLQQQF